MSEFWERLKHWWSRVDMRDRRTQFTLTGSLAAVVLVVGLIAWSVNGSSGSKPAVGSTTQRAAQLAQKAAEGKLPFAAPGGASNASTKTGSESAASVDVSKSAPASLPPVTATTIKIGITYLSDPNTANQTAGFGSVGRIDQRRGYEAMIREVNKVAPYGRKLVPVWYSQTTDEVTSKGLERVEQEACARFTQDNKVFMVWDGGLVGGETFHRCATKARIPEIGFSGGLSWSKTYRDFPYVAEPGDFALDRMAEVEVDQLYAHGYFSKFKDNAPPYTPQKPLDGKPKIGLIRYDQPAHKAGAVAMKARLAAHGLSLCSGCEFEVTYSSDNLQEILDDAAEVNAAIQSFKSKGVTHVIFLGSSNGTRIPIFFVDGAEKQQYRPRLGLNPVDGPTATRDFLGSESYPQFRDSVLIADGPDEFDVRTDAFKKCKKIFEEAGEDFSGSQGVNKQDEIPVWCDTAWYHIAVAEAVGRSLSVDSWMNGVATMVPVPSARVYLMQTKADRHDGSGAIRVGEWFDNCNCWKPTTGVIPV
jgi:hypothetical protein